VRAIDAAPPKTHVDPVQGEDEVTVGAARAAFFRENHFPADGGYEDDFAEADFGPVRYRVPNTKARGDALRVHDLHHVATGYPTDWRGEAEISGWELGSRLGVAYPYAWVTVLFGVFTGVLGHLAATFRAFVRGRRSDNLYGERFDPAWLQRRLSTLRGELKVKDEPPRPTAGDILAFAGWSLVALVFGVVAIPFVVLMVLDAARRALTGGCPFAAMSCSGS
jgi:hypothetical protein